MCSAPWINSERCLSLHGQTVRQGTRGCRREPDGNRRFFICGGAVQLVRTPDCHAGGRGFESRRSPAITSHCCSLTTRGRGHDFQTGPCSSRHRRNVLLLIRSLWRMFSAISTIRGKIFITLRGQVPGDRYPSDRRVQKVLASHPWTTSMQTRGLAIGPKLGRVTAALQAGWTTSSYYATTVLETAWRRSRLATIRRRSRWRGSRRRK
jgi:hypothetical protein